MNADTRHGAAGHPAWLATAVRRDWRLILMLAGLFGWIDVVPLYGPVAGAFATARGASFGSLPMWFLAAHGVALIVWGTVLDHRPGVGKASAGGSLVACALLTLILLGLPTPLWPACFAAMGVAAAAGVVAWGRLYATVVAPDWLGRVFALAAAVVELAKWISGELLAVVSANVMLAASVILLVAAGVALLGIEFGQGAKSSDAEALPPISRQSVARIALFIAFFSVVAGFSYQVISVRPLAPYLDESLRQLPYVGGILLSGWLADRRGLQLPLSAGAAFLATAFLLGAWGSPVTGYAGVGLNGLAFGFLEPTPWLLLAANARPATAGRWFGWGLNLNVAPIFIGAAITESLRALQPSRLGLWTAVAMVFAVIGLYGVDDPLIRRQARPLVTSRDDTPTLGERFDSCYGGLLTPRQLEVGRCAIAGLETAAIASRLHISENTVKTHLRHIYQKTGTSSRSELLRRLVSDVGRPA